MPGSLIAVHVDGPEVSGANLDALIAACNQVAIAGTCAPRSAVADSAATVDVSVVWDESFRAARIRVTRARGPERHRTVDFEEDDDVTERWRTVGLAVGVIAESMQAEGASAGEPPRSREGAHEADTLRVPEERPSPRSRPVVPPWRRSAWWVDLTAAVAPGFETGPWRLGTLVRGAYRPANAPLLVEIAGVAARRPPDADGVTVDFLTLGAGGAFAFSPFQEGEIRLRAGGALEIVAARLASVEGNSATGTATDFGLQGGLDGAYAVTGWCSIVVGADLVGSTTDTVVRVQGAPIGRVPPLTAAAILGVRLTAPSE